MIADRPLRASRASFFVSSLPSASSSSSSLVHMSAQRKGPVIVITGTPGTGKTTHAQLLANEVGLDHINIGDLVKEKGYYENFDEDWQSYTVDEDKVRFPPLFSFLLSSFL